MLNRILFVGLLCLYSYSVNSETIYKWTDSNGMTHYSDKKPVSQSQNFKEGIKSEQKLDIDAMQQKKSDSSSLANKAIPEKPLNSQQPGNTPNVATLPILSNQPSGFTEKEACVAENRKYKESLECFGRYTIRTYKGAWVKPEAYQNCQTINRPPLC